MKIVTSFCSGRILRQQVCLESWRAYGFPIVAIQSPGETPVLEAYFKGVEFLETSQVADAFERPACVRISAMLELAQSEPILIMNSDVSIERDLDEFREEWTSVPDDTLQVGIRHDYDGGWRRRVGSRLNKYGIDVFRITPAMARRIPDIGMAIGCPGWDYWIPYCLHEWNYKIASVKHRCFLHAMHEQTWPPEHYAKAIKLLNHYSGLNSHDMTRLIQELTGR